MSSTLVNGQVEISLPDRPGADTLMTIMMNGGLPGNNFRIANSTDSSNIFAPTIVGRTVKTVISSLHHIAQGPDTSSVPLYWARVLVLRGSLKWQHSVRGL